MSQVTSEKGKRGSWCSPQKDYAEALIGPKIHQYVRQTSDRWERQQEHTEKDPKGNQGQNREGEGKLTKLVDTDN